MPTTTMSLDRQTVYNFRYMERNKFGDGYGDSAYQGRRATLLRRYLPKEMVIDKVISQRTRGDVVIFKFKWHTRYKELMAKTLQEERLRVESM